MFANSLIGLREGLEAALVVTILAAYLVRVDRRDRLPAVALGVGAAIALSLLAGALLTFTAQRLTFEQQEVFGGVMSIVAVVFVTWMVFWMRSAARGLRAELDDRMRAAIDIGALSVATIAFLAVVREGLETALFFFSAARAAGSTVEPLVGFAAGIAVAVVLGWLLYRRAITLNLQRFFTITGALLILVAAGILAYGVHDLQEARVLPGLTTLAFDVSAQVPPESWYGTLLKGTLNFSPQTTVLEAVVWLLYVIPVMALFLRGSGVLRRGRALAGSSAAAALLVLLLGGCGGGEDAKGAGNGVAVTARDDACEVDTRKLAAGTHRIAVRNEGSKVTEVYVYALGDRIMGEIENVTPALTRDFEVALTPGKYEVACKPGMVGDGIRQPLTVTGQARSASASQQLDRAVAGYRRFVVAQTGELMRKTEIFARAIKDGDAERAKRLYAGSRVHYERIEPIAESFAELDFAIDIRENDVGEGQRWTGWHRIEKALWKDRDISDMGPIAGKLVADTKKLERTVTTTKITPEQLANGARVLMDEVATGKVTGEEERYSRTDLADFQGNLDGAKAAYGELRPIVERRDPDLALLVDRRFDEIQTALERHSSGGEFVRYDTLTKAQVRELADVVDAVSEPLSRVSGVVLR